MLIICYHLGINKSYLEIDEEAAREASQNVVKVDKEEDDETDENLSVDAIKTEKEKVETEEVVEECGVEVDENQLK